MKKLLFIAIALVLSLAIFHSCNEPLVDESVNDEISLKSANGTKSYIVVLNDAELNAELANQKGYEAKQEKAKSAAEKILKRAGITDGEIGFVYGTAIKGFSVKIAPGQLKKLENDPSVKYVEENQVVTLIEPKAKPGDGDVQATAQTVPWGIARVNGGVTYNGTKKAWIIDTGIDLDHPDLFVNTTLSKTFVPRTSSANDDNGHGSHVSGTVAAINDGVGVVGVAAGAQLVAVKVLDRRGSGTWDGVIAGIDYVAATATAGDVANMSLGGGFSESINDAVITAAAEKNIKFALAAGNESTDAATKSPASAEHTNIYTISAMDINDNFASFSNYGNPPVDYCEPGVSIYSTYKDGGYTTYSGTSMAAPHMAGILMWGLPGTDGTVNGDPDVTNSTTGYADPIGIVGGGTSTNNPPVANAGSDITVTDLNGDGELVTLNGTASSDDHGITSYIWTENGSTIASGVTPSVNFAVGTYTVTLTVSDGEFTDTDVVIVKVLEYTPTSIDLDASMEKIRSTRFVTLNWSGASGDNVVVKANGSVISTISNDGSETIDMGKSSGTFVFEVCETDGSTCSNPVTLVL